MEQLPQFNEILDRLSTGESLRSICAHPEMPSMSAFLRRVEAAPELAERYARAREACGDTMDSNVIDVAEDCRAGKIEPNAARVVIDAYKWRAAHLRPQRYGDISRTEITGAGGEPLSVTVSYDDRPAKVALSVQPKLLAAPKLAEDADGTEDDGL